MRIAKLSVPGILMLLITFYSISLNAETIPTISAGIDKITNLSDTDPPWNLWFTQLGKPGASSVLPQQGRHSYDAKNISDFKLDTAWVEGEKNYGIGASFSFTIEMSENQPDAEPAWGDPYQPNGLFYVLNGYYQTEKLWKENSRIKKLKMFYNGTPLCYIALLDVRSMQLFDLRSIFKIRYSEGKSGTINVKNGDVLKFEIIEVYPGTKYKDTSVTEFLGGMTGN